MASPSITTERLILRRWRDEDVAPFAASCADREVMRYIGDGGTRTRDEAARSVANFEREWDEKGFGLFAVARRTDGAFLGFTGLSEPSFLPEVMPAVEIGWRFAREHWSHGYASEAARAALDYGLNDLSLPCIVTIFQTGNAASRRIAEKLDMRFDRETTDPTCGRPVEVYRITAPG